MTVAVNQHDVAGGQQRLLHHLVRRRRSVGHEKHVVCAKSSSSLLLRNLDSSRLLQQAVEAPVRPRGFRQKQVQSITLARLANPVRFEDRLASCNRQRVARTYPPYSVLLHG